TISSLKKEYGDAIIPLIFHVDYWDRLGWKDTFSSNDYTQRQREYAAAERSDEVYTPQMIVQGNTGFVGSDGGRARREINALMGQAPAVSVTSKPSADGHSVKISVTIPPDVAKSAKNLVVVVFENAPPVHVERGENSGATMSGDFAV